MKKIIAVLLVICMLFAFVGCKDSKDGDNSSFGLDFNYYISTGQINDAKYSLGINPDEIEKAAEGQSGNHDHTGGDGQEGIITYADYMGKEAYSVDGFYYCFKTGEEEKGISCIIGTDVFYGFTVGTSTKFEISSALSNLETETAVSNSKDFFYMPFEMENIDTLVCKSGKNVLKFYFEEDILIAACLYDSEKWEF